MQGARLAHRRRHTVHDTPVPFGFSNADAAWYQIGTSRHEAPIVARRQRQASDIELEQHHVAVLHDVFLALAPHDALLARALPPAVAHELVEADRVRLDEAAL